MQRLAEHQRSASARLDELPITWFHRRVMWLLGFVFFAELGGINAFSFVAPAVMKDWNVSISTISVIVSSTFVGMFIGATSGGWLSDRKACSNGHYGMVFCVLPFELPCEESHRLFLGASAYRRGAFSDDRRRHHVR